MKFPNLSEEKDAFKKGYDFVIGLDEVGRGAFAGPVVVGAVLFDKNILRVDLKKSFIKDVDDSKKIRPDKRESLSTLIRNGFIHSIATIPVSTINKHGIAKAAAIGFRKAIEQIKECSKGRYFVLIDGFHIKYIKDIGLKNQKGIIKGDGKCFSIAASSIIAKVHRDYLMVSLDKKFPKYCFSKNKGYGTKEHQEAIRQHGLSKIHRTSFNLQKFTF
ncbi:MAG: ribonuclease HII [Patescibacteria group bacterium]|nr:ribonuclease HII [Patescibacteria group bacterium]